MRSLPHAGATLTAPEPRSKGHLGHFWFTRSAHLVENEILIPVCLACARARGVLDADLVGTNATFATPPIFVDLFQWSDKVLTE